MGASNPIEGLLCKRLERDRFCRIEHLSERIRLGLRAEQLDQQKSGSRIRRGRSAGRAEARSSKNADANGRHLNFRSRGALLRLGQPTGFRLSEDRAIKSPSAYRLGH